eukprot:gene22731-29895_t
MVFGLGQVTALLSTMALVLLHTPIHTHADVEPQLLRSSMVLAAKKLFYTFHITPEGMMPYSVEPKWEPKKWAWRSLSGGWTAGFFPGCLWEMYRLRDWVPEFAADWTTLATISMLPLAPTATRVDIHDIGFFIGIPFGTAMDIGFLNDGSNLQYKDVLLTAAKSLSRRFVPGSGTFRSWDGNGGEYRGVQVIIDNMMNLELMFMAANLSGSATSCLINVDLMFMAVVLSGSATSWYDEAVSHAKVTAKNHFREDGSTYHRVIYSDTTGDVLSAGTVQGYADDSCWSRGQAWAIHGFANTYGSTGIPLFLETAQKAADYYISHLEEDSVPVWDFQTAQKDANYYISHLEEDSVPVWDFQTAQKAADYYISHLEEDSVPVWDFQTAQKDANYYISHLEEDSVPVWDFQTAQKDANDYISHLEEDSVPVWDFQAPLSQPWRDTSAAAIAACGLIELHSYIPDKGYRDVAEATIGSLSRWVLVLLL